MRLSPEDIRRGMVALERELGHDRALAFLQAVAGGALETQFSAPFLQWLRRNPEVAVIGLTLLGVGADVALKALSKPRRRPEPASPPTAAPAIALPASTEK